MRTALEAFREMLSKDFRLNGGTIDFEPVDLLANDRIVTRRCSPG